MFILLKFSQKYEFFIAFLPAPISLPHPLLPSLFQFLFPNKAYTDTQMLTIVDILEWFSSFFKRVTTQLDAITNCH